MDSKTKTLVMAAIVASIAVLAFLPADDVSADPSVSYLGTTVDSGNEYTTLGVELDSPLAGISITLGDSYIGYYIDMDGFTSTEKVYMTSSADGSAAVVPDGTYSYVLRNLNTNAVLDQDSITIGSSRTLDDAKSDAEAHMDAVFENSYMKHHTAPDYSDWNARMLAIEPSIWNVYSQVSSATTAAAVDQAIATMDESLINALKTDTLSLLAAAYNDGQQVDGKVLPMNAYDTAVSAIAAVEYTNSSASVSDIDAIIGAYETAMSARTDYVEPTPHAITVSVTGIEGVGVTAQVEGAVAKEAVQGETVKLVPGDYDTGKYSVAYTVNGEAITGDSFSMPDKDVEVVAAFTEKTTVPDGISVDGKNYNTISEAIKAAQSGQTVEVATDVTEDITLADGVSVEITEKGSYTGTVAYDGSKVKIISLGAGSEITISAGSVHISGTFTKSSEISVPAGQFVLDDVAVSEDAKVVIDLDEGTELSIGTVAVGKNAILEIKGEGTVLLPDSTKLTFDATSIYRGPAFTEDGSSSGKLVSFAYPEDSRITYDERTYMVHLFTGGSYTFAVGLQYYEATYSGEVIKLEDLLGQNWTTKVFYVNDGNIESFVSTTEGNTTTENSITKVRVDDESVTEIRNPGIYDYAYRIRTTVEDTSGNTLTSYRYVDFGVIVGYLNVDDLKITAANQVYDGTEKVAQLTASDATAELEIIGYTDLQGNTVKPIEAGDYYVVVRVGGFYDAVVSDVKFTIEKAPTELALDKTVEAWDSEQYKDGNVTYTVDPSVYVDDSGAVLNVKLVATVEGKDPVTVTGTIASQADLDKLIKDAFTGSQYDSGYTLVITLTNVESKNYKAADPADTAATVTVTIGNFPPTKIYATFGADSDNIKVAQDGEEDYTVEITSTGNGLSKGADGNYVFTITVDPSVSIVLKTAAADELGRVLMSEPVVYIYDDDADIAKITFTLSKLPAETSKYTFQIVGDSRYTTSEVYTLDISNVFSDEVALYLVEENYPTIVYTVNQLYDLQGQGATLADGVKFYLPATASSSNNHWELQLPSTSKKTTTYYADNGAYLVDTADRTSYTAWNNVPYYGIVFVASNGDSPSPVDPTAEQSITIVATGFYANGGEDVANAINAAYTANGRTTNLVSASDCDVNTMYVVFITTVDGTINGTVSFGDRTLTLGDSDGYTMTAGIHALYWTQNVNGGGYVEGFEAFTTGTAYTISVYDVADTSISASMTVGADAGNTPAPSTDYTEALAVAVYQNSTTKAVSVMIGTSDMKAVPAGTATITLTYQYLEHDDFLDEDVLATGTMTLTYEFTGSTGYAFVPVDFSQQTGSSSILGARAAVTVGDLSDTSAFLAFTLA